MTKKHYEAIASIIKLNFDGLDTVFPNDLVDYFMSDNRNFQPHKFLIACGITPEACPDCKSEIDLYYRSCTNKDCEHTQTS